MLHASLSRPLTLQWPDKDVPDIGALLTFWRAYDVIVRERSSHVMGPVLVHCSAGVGRTGTFIAIDMLCRHADAPRPAVRANVEKVAPAEKESPLEPREVVRQLRQCRMHMVQTVSQVCIFFFCFLSYY